jgi:hypothetical protein
MALAIARLAQSVAGIGLAKIFFAFLVLRVKLAERLSRWRTRRVLGVLFTDIGNARGIIGVERAKSAFRPVGVIFADIGLASRVFGVQITVRNLAGRVIGVGVA